MLSFAEFPEVAGGFVTSTLATGDASPYAKGCKIVRTGAGTHVVTLADAVPSQTRFRVWTQNMGAQIPHNIVVVPTSLLQFTIFTYALGVDDDPVDLTFTLANFAFAFGVSIIPE